MAQKTYKTGMEDNPLGNVIYDPDDNAVVSSNGIQQLIKYIIKGLASKLSLTSSITQTIMSNLNISPYVTSKNPNGFITVTGGNSSSLYIDIPTTITSSLTTNTINSDKIFVNNLDVSNHLMGNSITANTLTLNQSFNMDNITISSDKVDIVRSDILFRTTTATIGDVDSTYMNLTTDGLTVSSTLTVQGANDIYGDNKTVINKSSITTRNVDVDDKIAANTATVTYLNLDSHGYGSTILAALPESIPVGRLVFIVDEIETIVLNTINYKMMFNNTLIDTYSNGAWSSSEKNSTNSFIYTTEATTSDINISSSLDAEISASMSILNNSVISGDASNSSWDTNKFNIIQPVNDTTLEAFTECIKTLNNIDDDSILWYKNDTLVNSSDYDTNTFSNSGSDIYSLYVKTNNNIYIAKVGAISDSSAEDITNSTFTNKISAKNSDGYVIVTIDSSAVASSTYSLGTINLSVQIPEAGASPSSVSTATLLSVSSGTQYYSKYVTNYSSVEWRTSDGASIGNATFIENSSYKAYLSVTPLYGYTISAVTCNNEATTYSSGKYVSSGIKIVSRISFLSLDELFPVKSIITNTSRKSGMTSSDGKYKISNIVVKEIVSSTGTLSSSETTTYIPSTPYQITFLLTLNSSLYYNSNLTLSYNGKYKDVQGVKTTAGGSKINITYIFTTDNDKKIINPDDISNGSGYRIYTVYNGKKQDFSSTVSIASSDGSMILVKNKDYFIDSDGDTTNPTSNGISLIASGLNDGTSTNTCIYYLDGATVSTSIECLKNDAQYLSDTTLTTEIQSRVVGKYYIYPRKISSATFSVSPQFYETNMTDLSDETSTNKAHPAITPLQATPTVSVNGVQMTSSRDYTATYSTGTNQVTITLSGKASSYNYLAASNSPRLYGKKTLTYSYGNTYFPLDNRFSYINSNKEKVNYVTPKWINSSYNYTTGTIITTTSGNITKYAEITSVPVSANSNNFEYTGASINCASGSTYLQLIGTNPNHTPTTVTLSDATDYTSSLLSGNTDTINTGTLTVYATATPSSPNGALYSELYTYNIVPKDINNATSYDYIVDQYDSISATTTTVNVSSTNLVNDNFVIYTTGDDTTTGCKTSVASIKINNLKSTISTATFNINLSQQTYTPSDDSGNVNLFTTNGYNNNNVDNILYFISPKQPTIPMYYTASGNYRGVKTLNVKPNYKTKVTYGQLTYDISSGKSYTDMHIKTPVIKSATTTLTSLATLSKSITTFYSTFAPIKSNATEYSVVSSNNPNTIGGAGTAGSSYEGYYYAYTYKNTVMYPKTRSPLTTISATSGKMYQFFAYYGQTTCTATTSTFRQELAKFDPIAYQYIEQIAIPETGDANSTQTNCMKNNIIYMKAAGGTDTTTINGVSYYPRFYTFLTNRNWDWNTSADTIKTCCSNVGFGFGSYLSNIFSATYTAAGVIATTNPTYDSTNGGLEINTIFAQPLYNIDIAIKAPIYQNIYVPTEVKVQGARLVDGILYWDNLGTNTVTYTTATSTAGFLTSSTMQYHSTTGKGYQYIKMIITETQAGAGVASTTLTSGSLYKLIDKSTNGVNKFNFMISRVLINGEARAPIYG